MPLPITPLRRTERKRDPAPPALVGKLNFAVSQAAGVQPWPTTTIDLLPLMDAVSQVAGQKYRYIDITLDSFSFDPAELPVLYITGWTPLPEWGDPIRDRLRRYLYDGGTLFLHSQCGRPEFNDSVRRELARLFPDRPLVALDGDHPIFRSVEPIRQMQVRKDAQPMQTVPPYLEGMHLGVRCAVVFSPIDLSIGWNVAQQPIEGGVLYDMADSRRLGANIVAYALANTPYARRFGVQTVFVEQSAPPGDALVIAQLVHRGDWDPAPHAWPNLVMNLRQNTTLQVTLRRDLLRPSDEALLDYPIAYLVGLRDFAFDAAERAALREYLLAGGKLLIENAGGWAGFDSAARRELALILPEHRLTPANLDHPIFDVNYQVSTVEYSAGAQADLFALNRPALEVLTIDGRPAVVYSPYALSRGLEQFPDPYTRGLAPDSALRLTTNVLTYMMIN